MSIEVTESTKAALIDLELKEGSSLTEVRMQYLEKTTQNKFQRVLGNDDSLQNEFLKYYKAYITLVRSFSQKEASTDMSYYPPDKVFLFHLNQGIYYFLYQDYLKAGEKFQEAFRINKKNSLVQLYLGVLLLKRKNYYAAEKYFTNIAKADPNNEDAWFYLGESYFKAGELRKAYNMYDTAKKLNPYRSEIAFRMKEIKEQLGGGKAGKKESFFSRLFKKKSG
jgi:tetratricopeptide (TPR) repeat protein